MEYPFNNAQQKIEWREVPWAPEYSVSDHGEVIGTRGKKLKLTSRKGYFCCDIRGAPTRVNRLVCIIFHGKPPSDLHQAAHHNGKKSDNTKDNLYWATQQENANDIIRHGSLRGKKHPRTRFTDDDIKTIRERHSNGETISSIHRSYASVCYATISHIIHRRNWAHVVSI